jgi:hypothetical protein
MKSARLIILGFAIILCAGPALGWGWTGHRLVNAMAIEALRSDAAKGRPGAQAAYRLLNDQRFLFIASADLPDLAIQFDSAQYPEHFLDLEDFGGPEFIRALPSTRPADVPDSSGRLPWVIGDCAREMRTAVRRGRPIEALRAAIRLAHFAGDAHVPLHATRDYDGRSRAAKGIHARWEWRLVEAMVGLDSIASPPPRDLITTAAALPAAALERGAELSAARTIETSFDLVDGVLADDERARAAAGWITGAPGEWEDTAPDVAAYLREMERLQGETVRIRLAESARLVADLAAAAVAGGRSLPQVRIDELRLDKTDVDSTPDELRVSLSLMRLSAGRAAASPRRIEVRDAARPTGAPWFSVPVNPPRECGEETTAIIIVPRALLEGIDTIELRLVPADAVTPEDNRVHVKRRSSRSSPGWR